MWPYAPSGDDDGNGGPPAGSSSSNSDELTYWQEKYGVTGSSSGGGPPPSVDISAFVFNYNDTDKGEPVVITGRVLVFDLNPLTEYALLRQCYNSSSCCRRIAVFEFLFLHQL